jgi:anaerobic dimethyl sulfoxide reductase subunit A
VPQKTNKKVKMKMSEQSKESSVAGKKVNRRSMLKWTGALAGAAVAGAVAGFGAGTLLRPAAPVAPSTTPPLSLKPPLSSAVQSRVDQIVKDKIALHEGETLNYVGCASGCGTNCLLGVRTKNGVITAIEGDNRFFPNTGIEDSEATPTDLIKAKVSMRGCAMGYGMNFNMNAPSRLLYPMKRIPGTTRGDPQFVRISWDEALDTFTTKLKETVDKYGPYSVFMSYGTYPNSATWAAILSWMKAGVGGWGYCTWDTQRLTQQLMLGWPGFGSAAPTGNDPDIFNSKLIVFYGYTPTTTNWGTARKYYMRLAKEKGIPIIVIDPKYTTEAEVYADQWIPMKPGTGAAFLLAVINVITKEKLYDPSYVEKYTNGFEKVQQEVLGANDGIEKTPEWAEKITAIPAETIREFARLYAKSKPVFLKWHYGAVRRSYSEQEARLAVTLQAISGNFGTPGGFHALNDTDGAPMPGTGVSYGKWNADYSIPTMYRLHKWPQAFNLLEKARAGQITKQEYDKLVGNGMRDLPLPNYKMCFADKNSIITGSSAADQAAEAYRSLDFVVSFTEHLHSTAKFADLLMPMALPWEYDQMYSHGTGQKILMWSPKLVNPPGEARDPELIRCQIAKRLGFVDKYNPLYQSDDTWESNVRDAWTKGYANFQKAMSDKGFTVPNWEEFQTRGFVKYTEYLDTPFNYPWEQVIEQGKLPTTSKKIELYNEYLDKTDPTEPLSGGFNEMTLLGYKLPGTPTYIPTTRGMDTPLVPKYPLMLLTSHSRHHGFSSHYWNPMIQGEVTDQRVWLNPSDAATRGIKDGDIALITSDTGRVAIPAYVTSRMSPGVVLVRYGAPYEPNSQGIDRGGNSNTLVNPLDGAPHWPAGASSQVQVEKY